jgi:hypothetical protein
VKLSPEENWWPFSLVNEWKLAYQDSRESFECRSTPWFEIWGFHVGEGSIRGLLGCDTVKCGGGMSTFRTNLLPPSSVWSPKTDAARYLTAALHGVTTQKTSTWIYTTVYNELENHRSLFLLHEHSHLGWLSQERCPESALSDTNCSPRWSSYAIWRLFLFANTPVYKGVSESFRTESITKYMLITINTRWEATQSVMAAKLTRLTHKIVIQLNLLAESYNICSSRSRRPVRKLLDTSSYWFRQFPWQ